MEWEYMVMLIAFVVLLAMYLIEARRNDNLIELMQIADLVLDAYRVDVRLKTDTIRLLVNEMDEIQLQSVWERVSEITGDSYGV